MSELRTRRYALVRKREDLACENIYDSVIDHQQEAADIAEDIKTLCEHYNVLEIYLPLSSICDRSLSALLPSLKPCQLRKLDLSRNDITCDGAEQLAESLTAFFSLCVLDLSLNRISDRGAKVLAEMIPLCASLRELDLARNDLKEDGKSAIVTAAHSRKPSTLLLSM